MRLAVSSLRRSLVALLLWGAVARAESPAEPAAGRREERAPSILLFAAGADVGGTPAFWGARVGGGAVRGGGDARVRRTMVWLEVDGTERARPRRPKDAGRRDAALWVYPHLELGYQLVPRSLLLGFAEAGPMLGRYSAGPEAFWHPGFCVGAGVQWALLRVGVRYLGQWRRATLPAAPPGASREVRVDPAVFVTAGLELFLPAIPHAR